MDKQGDKLKPHSSIDEIEKVQRAVIKLGEASSTSYNKPPDDNSLKLDIKSIIEESFEGENGILETFKAAYAEVKENHSKAHMDFIMQWYFKGGEGEEGIKEFRIIEEIVE